MSHPIHVPADGRDKVFVGRLMREARFGRGLTPMEAANAMHISRTAYYRLEAGRIGSTTARIICWLLRDGVEKSHDVTYWRERALMAERRLVAINQHLVEYSAARKAIERDDDGFDPGFVEPREGMRARAA